ncbi:hypothetical protein [Polaromonas sp.]|uniref:hypothetical protein n=1 Tax=Polaromonas sp. TaxID=1869339 RepID=UPI00272F33F1|nr:hypothetical protein [Polaromonas sp.]MDP1740172.1 hypothetical protein [Polaromonas sp.]
MSLLFRDELLAAAAQAAFPPERTTDPVSGQEVFDAEAGAVLARVFELFGVSALSPHDDDADKVINTACTLATEVAGDLERLCAVGGNADALEGTGAWHPVYRAYLSALWQGDQAGIAHGARVLQISQGIPNGSLPLDAGPLA